MENIATRLLAHGMAKRQPDGAIRVSAAGQQVFDKMTSEYRKRLSQFIERWSPEDHAEVRQMLNRLSRSMIATLPAAGSHTEMPSPDRIT